MGTFYRSVWISDVHLCSRDSQSEPLYQFLDAIKCDYLYLVGDIIDVWALRKRWHWPAQYNEVVHKLLKRSRKGAKVTFVPGNHDEFFRDFTGYRFGDVNIALSAVHTMADGRKLWVTHGDEFDSVVRFHPWLAHLGDWAYGYLVPLNRFINMVRRWWGLPYWSFSGSVKRKVKKAVTYVSRFEEAVVAETRRRDLHGVVCGHIHQPAMRDVQGVLYCNTGDWIENCTALVEHHDGKLEMIWWHEQSEQIRAAAGNFNGASHPPNGAITRKTKVRESCGEREEQLLFSSSARFPASEVVDDLAEHVAAR